MFRNIPGVAKNLLYINIIMFLATYLLLDFRQMLSVLGLFYFDSPNFMPHQLITHMFMHGGFFHILLNMFMLVMFGSILERVWGPQRFLFYYLFTGFGAVLIHQGVQALEVYNIVNSITLPDGTKDAALSTSRALQEIYFTPTVGASGAIYGLLIAFGVLFPNTELMLIFFPMPVKAKYFIPILVVLELFMGIRGGDGVAHFAHLGGALFGFLLLRYWKKDRSNFY